MIALPTRSGRYGIGKQIGEAVYLHRDYQHILGAPVNAAQARIPADFPYTIIKFSLRTGNVTFIASPDFDVSPEPVAGDHWIVPPEHPAKFRPVLPDPYLYHHKWLMVSDDYKGFDVEASRARSRHWLSLSGIDKSRIGRRSYWEQTVLPRLSGC